MTYYTYSYIQQKNPKYCRPTSLQEEIAIVNFQKIVRWKSLKVTISLIHSLL
jgi:hypothetical protein